MAAATELELGAAGDFGEDLCSREWLTCANVESDVGHEHIGFRSCDSPRIRVLTFNILADSLAQGSEASPDVCQPCPDIFEENGAGGVVYHPWHKSDDRCFQFSCAKDVLLWSRRWRMLKAQILALEPDLIGLQEVDLLTVDDEKLEAHDAEIRHDLESAGYDGAFARKHGRASDGVALFWRQSRLRREGDPETWSLGASVHVALAQRLCLDNKWQFLAVATHLKAGLFSEAETAREKQSHRLLQLLKPHPSAIVLADLNAHCGVPVTSGGSDAEVKGTMSQPRAYPLLVNSLKSAYKAVQGEEPNFTCWGGWADREVRIICDYILTKGTMFRPWRVLQVPTVASIVKYAERLPNWDFPSDHVPLAADLNVCETMHGPADDTGQPQKRRSLYVRPRPPRPQM